jgi:hypothetical protein
MTRQGKPRDVAASVRQRLFNLAQTRATDFNRILQRYVGERFLYRLSLSNEVDRFTLKGAALFLVWAGKEFRATRDVDLLASGSADHAVMRRSVEAICAVHCPEDGLSFDPASIQVTDIREEQEYGGLRVKLRASLGSAVLPLQVDVGFGDAINPERSEAEYPTLLDHPAPRLWTYPRETSVAEKFDAMVRLGPVNSRMRDFWDVAALAQQFPFDGETLRTAIDETFRRRGTTLTAELPVALGPAFYEDALRVRLWEAFQRQASAAIDAPTRFDDVGERVRAFLGPIRQTLVQGEPFTWVWPAGGPWQPGASRVGRGEADV